MEVNNYLFYKFSLRQVIWNHYANEEKIRLNIQKSAFEQNLPASDFGIPTTSELSFMNNFPTSQQELNQLKAGICSDIDMKYSHLVKNVKVYICYLSLLVYDYPTCIKYGRELLQKDILSPHNKFAVT
mmetsp:Transcript_7389/g.6643  ORF Transcript_7389/g.6643 Transcript_7389/m.6643 type:complete len:128 (-) Transcript_7389:465-848(-)